MAADAPLVLVVAPAGYGKTTLLGEWERGDDRPFAWLSVQDADNEPDHLLASVDRVLALRAGDGEACVLVVDDAHVLHGPASAAALSAIAGRLPPGSVVAIASRCEPPLPIGRLRAHGILFELRAEDLVMSALEAGVLLSRAGLDLREADVQTLVRRTEGWAAGLSLAAMSLRGRTDVDHALARFGGDNRLVAEYLREELLAELSPDMLAFVTQTSVLDRLTGPLCDAVLQRRGSAVVLRGLVRSSLPIAALDDTEDDFRHHPLLAQMLGAELRRTQPERELDLHRRASRWHGEHGDCERAIDHAIAAGEVERAGELLWELAAAYAWSGRNGKIAGWLARFDDEAIARSSALALTAATSQLMRGERDLVEHWTAAAERQLERSADAQRAELRAALPAMRAAVARDVQRMGEQATLARSLVPADSPWCALSELLAGVAEQLTGQREAARAHLEEGARRGAVAAPWIELRCLSQLALIALQQGEWDHATELAGRALGQVERLELDEDETQALVYALSALVHVLAGRVEDAEPGARKARRLLARRTELAPWYDAEARIALALVSLRLTDVTGARALLSEASRLLRRSPDAVVLRRWIDDVWAQVDRFAAGALVGPASLTIAELRVLRFLPSHLSFREIAARLHVSTNTVKTQAHALYRKLDVCSRSEAVARACELGLIDP
jgi:LuxR family maltose regulon positive regulatory protein